MDFGDYCYIEQKRFGVPNEQYLHKVIGRLESTAWVDVPVRWQLEEINHDTMEPVLACICCGVSEREVRRYRESDCRYVDVKRKPEESAAGGVWAQGPEIPGN